LASAAGGDTSASAAGGHKPLPLAANGNTLPLATLLEDSITKILKQKRVSEILI
jgi:hypothetical protein